MLGFAGGGRDEVLIWHESRAQPPSLLVTALDGSASRPLAAWPDPHPQLTGIAKQLLVP